MEENDAGRITAGIRDDSRMALELRNKRRRIKRIPEEISEN
jgi:hypothetical protein